MVFASGDSTSKLRCNNFSSAVCGTAKVLKETLVIISRNVKLFSAIALLLFIPSSLLFLIAEFVIKPQASDFLAKNAEMNPGDLSSLSQLLKRALLMLSEEFLILACLWILSVFSMVLVMISASAVTNYSDQKECYDLSLGELLVKIRTPWKKAAITWLYVTLFNMGLVAVYVLVAMLITKGSGTLTHVVLTYSLAVLSYLLNLFLVVVWMLGVAISVLEDGSCYGMKALSKAWGLIFIKGRVLIQGFLLAALLALIMLPVSAIRGWKVVKDDRESMILGVLSVGVSGLLQLFSYVAYTVFYYDCKESTCGGEKMDLNKKGRYSLIPLSTTS